MALPEGDSCVGHSFGLEFDGITIKSITEISGLKMEQDVVEHKENTPDGKYPIKQLPGRPKAGDITLTRGLTSDKSFEKWINDSRFGKMTDVRKGGSVIVFDFEGKEVKRYKLTNAWPKSLEIGSLKAGDTAVLQEKLVAHLRVHRSPERLTMRRAADAARGRGGGGVVGPATPRPDAQPEPLRTEFAFLLPRGYVDSSGTVHRDGVMRLATARDELVPLRDDRVRENPAYLTVVLLARVVMRIGTHRGHPRGRDREPVRGGPGLPAGPLPPGQHRGPHPGGRDLPGVLAPVRRRRRRWSPGGIVTYAAERLYEEVAYVAYYLHWSRDEILDLEHPERQRFVAQIAALNTRIQQG